MVKTDRAKPRPDDPQIYRIELNGILDQKWAEWFDGFTITYQDNTNTLLTGKIQDQSALHGILANIRDLGLTLVSINTAGNATQRGTEE